LTPYGRQLVPQTRHARLNAHGPQVSLPSAPGRPLLVKSARPVSRRTSYQVCNRWILVRIGFWRKQCCGFCLLSEDLLSRPRRNCSVQMTFGEGRSRRLGVRPQSRRGQTPGGTPGREINGSEDYCPSAGRHLAAEFDANPRQHGGRKLLGLNALNKSCQQPLRRWNICCSAR
jgi:hypothetical protein